MRRGSLAYCTLPAGAVSHAVVHQTVEEIWYCLADSGQVWRRGPMEAEIGTQFRAIAANELHLLIATMPPWSDAHEALPVVGYWDAS